MADLDSTYSEAVARANELVDFYGKERVRMEDGLIKLLLPAGLSFLAALSKDIIDAKLAGGAWFLIAFFVAYAVMIYIDTYAAERALDRARALQDMLYRMDDAKDRKLSEVATAETLDAYRNVESDVGRQRYIKPTGKPIIAALAGLAFLLIHHLS
jgi:hypothetical protein